MKIIATIIVIASLLAFLVPTSSGDLDSWNNGSTATINVGKVNASDMFFGGQSVTRATLTHAGTVTLDCGITNRLATLSLTGSVTFATANLAAGKWYNVVVTMTSTNDTPTFPAWLWLGGAPSTLTGGKVGWLSIFPQSTTDATTLAAYTETQ